MAQLLDQLPKHMDKAVAHACMGFTFPEEPIS